MYRVFSASPATESVASQRTTGAGCPSASHALLVTAARCAAPPHSHRTARAHMAELPTQAMDTADDGAAAVRQLLAEVGLQRLWEACVNVSDTYSLDAATRRSVDEAMTALRASKAKDACASKVMRQKRQTDAARDARANMEGGTTFVPDAETSSGRVTRKRKTS